MTQQVPGIKDVPVGTLIKIHPRFGHIIILILVQFSCAHVKAALAITRAVHWTRMKTLQIYKSINPLLIRKELVWKFLTLLIIPVRYDALIGLMALCAPCPVHVSLWTHTKVAGPYMSFLWSASLARRPRQTPNLGSVAVLSPLSLEPGLSVTLCLTRTWICATALSPALTPQWTLDVLSRWVFSGPVFVHVYCYSDLDSVSQPLGLAGVLLCHD